MKNVIILLSVLTSINAFAKASNVKCNARVDTVAFLDKEQEMVLEQTIENEIDILRLKIENVEFEVAVDKDNLLQGARIVERDTKGQPLAVLLQRNLVVKENSKAELSIKLQGAPFNFASIYCSIDEN